MIIQEERFAAARAIVGGCQTLPVMPEVAMRVINTMSDDLVDLSEVARIIELDPAISARVVGLANSAYFRREQEIASVRQAIIGSLGLDLTRGVAIGMACSSAFDLSACPSFELDDFWGRSLATSCVARQLACASDVDQIDPESCALTGLLDDIGLLGLAALEGATFDSVLRNATAHDLTSLIEQQYRCTQYDVALALAEAWELPVGVTAHFVARSDTEREKEESENTLVVSFAREIVEQGRDPGAGVQPGTRQRLETLGIACGDLEFLNLGGILASSQAAMTAYP